METPCKAVITKSGNHSILLLQIEDFPKYLFQTGMASKKPTIRLGIKKESNFPGL